MILKRLLGRKLGDGRGESTRESNQGEGDSLEWEMRAEGEGERKIDQGQGRRGIIIENNRECEKKRRNRRKRDFWKDKSAWKIGIGKMVLFFLSSSFPFSSLVLSLFFPPNFSSL